MNRFSLRAWPPPLFALVAAGVAAPLPVAQAQPRPNIVLVVADDLGYGDLPMYAASATKTPNLQRLADRGVTFTSYYSASSVGSASRAALITGCYPQRVGISGILGPESRFGIHTGELTIAELLRRHGYQTACIGKWQLGRQPRFWPTAHGFDRFTGYLYSPVERDMAGGMMLHNGQPLDVSLDRWHHFLTDQAVEFIGRNSARTFFLYFATNLPRVPLPAAAADETDPLDTPYRMAVREIDRSVGRIMKALDELQIADDTLIVFLSDNGPWEEMGNHAGSTGGLRGGKWTTFEGGFRVPCIARWPRQIRPGWSSDALVSSMDWLPTLAELMGHEPTSDRPIDGKSLLSLLLDPRRGASPHDAFYYYLGRKLQAVRSGPWKLHLPHTYRQLESAGADGAVGVTRHLEIDRSLFNLSDDPGESNDLSGQYPRIVQRLEALAERARADLGDETRQVKGTGVRRHGK